MTNVYSDVLIIEGTHSVALVFQNWLRQTSRRTEVAGNGEDGLELLRTGKYALAILDADLETSNGLEILKIAEAENIKTKFIVVTSRGSVGTAVEAMRLGAQDFLIKPVAQDRLRKAAETALDSQNIKTNVPTTSKKTAIQSRQGFVGSCPKVVEIRRTIKRIADSNASVFITGDSGTGKEVCAQSIHQTSSRRDKNFIAINCAAIPKELMESEIFGHVPGAFTGATSERAGAAISANGGTLFLDEICEMELSLQTKLLRFLQSGTFQKVGSDKEIKVDCRIVCATNRNPVIEVAEGRFREDLFFRLHVLPIHLPPLCERGSDIIEIANHFLRSISKEEGKNFRRFSDPAERDLLSFSWPGNIRELQNVIRKAVILNDSDVMTEDMLDLDQCSVFLFALRSERQSFSANQKTVTVSLEQDFAEIERDIIEAAIMHCGNSIPKASDMLQLSPSTIYRKKEGWSTTPALQQQTFS
ncbi:MAG: sigma-54 dependent transcriptional regulator [Pseudomonadota bacterium]